MLNEILSWCPLPRPGYIYLAQIHHINDKWDKSVGVFPHFQHTLLPLWRSLSPCGRQLNFSKYFGERNEKWTIIFIDFNC